MSEPSRTVSGKWIILSFLSVALAMATSAWAYYYFQQRRPMELWGADTARLIVQAPKVEGWRLSVAMENAAETDAQTISVGSQRLTIVERRELTNARGLLHFRKGLLNDRCFDWNADVSATTDDWRYALSFSDGDAQATLLFAPTSQRLRSLESGAEVSIAPIAAGLEAFLAEHFPEESP